MERLVRLLVDGGELFFYRKAYGPNLITAWARIEGRTVGIIANNPMHWAGALDDKATRKAASSSTSATPSTSRSSS